MYVTLQRVLELREQRCLGFVLSPVWKYCSPSFILAMDHKEVCLIAINSAINIFMIANAGKSNHQLVCC